MLPIARKTLSSIVICLAIVGSLTAEEERPNSTARSPYDAQATFRRGLPKEQLVQLKHQVTALQSELEMLQERLNYQDGDLSSIRQELDQVGHTSNQYLEQVANLEVATSSMEQDLASVCKDNEKCQKVLAQFQSQIRQIDKNADVQGQNLRNLEKAVHALVELMQKNDRNGNYNQRVGLNSSVSQPMHVVKEGDTLEKIARQHNTTIEAIKEANGLVNDRIIAGKKLKIPTQGPL